MNRTTETEAVLRAWMDARATTAVPGELLPTVLAETARTRQVRGWIPDLGLSGSLAVPRPLAWLALVVALALAAAALVVGARDRAEVHVQNGRLVFVASGAATGDPTGMDIYAVDPDGSGRTAITETPSLEWSPVWSPDGRRLAFARELRPGAPLPPGPACESDPIACERGRPGDYALVVTSVGGTDVGAEAVLHQASGAINAVAWSPDGRHLSFIHDRSGGLVVLDLDSGASRLVLPGSTDLPAWAPDGSGLAAAGPSDLPGTDLYLAFLDDRGAVRLTHDGGYESAPAWSPDGSQLAFDVDPDGSGVRTRIDVMTIGAGDRRVLVEEASGAAWSPDGEAIAFVKTHGDATGRSNEIWLAEPDGRAQRKLGDEGSRPMWSPDGSTILWRGRGGVWLADRDGSPATKIPLDDDVGFGIDWQPVYP